MKELLEIVREARITPKKIEQFVSIWKRNKEGITEPRHVNDAFERLIIECKSGNKSGRFIFPKSVLIEKGIIATTEKEGKRGFRVYPPWDEPQSKQAIETKKWQVVFFEIDKKYTQHAIVTENYQSIGK